jgi:hypothetical protein
MGSLVGAASLVLGPALFGIGVAQLHDVWPGALPDYEAVNAHHDQNVLGTHLATLGFPFLVISVFAIAWAARDSRRLAGAGILTSVFGLLAMFGNGLMAGTVTSMAGIDEHEPLDQLTRNLTDDAPVVLWSFPLYVVGAVLLGAALWRSGAVPRWSAVLVALGAAMPVGVLTGVGLLSLVVASLRIAGSVPVIKALLTPGTRSVGAAPAPESASR